MPSKAARIFSPVPRALPPIENPGFWAEHSTAEAWANRPRKSANYRRLCCAGSPILLPICRVANATAWIRAALFHSTMLKMVLSGNLRRSNHDNAIRQQHSLRSRLQHARSHLQPGRHLDLRRAHRAADGRLSLSIFNEEDLPWRTCRTALPPIGLWAALFFTLSSASPPCGFWPRLWRLAIRSASRLAEGRHAYAFNAKSYCAYRNAHYSVPGDGALGSRHELCLAAPTGVDLG